MEQQKHHDDDLMPFSELSELIKSKGGDFQAALAGFHEPNSSCAIGERIALGILEWEDSETDAKIRALDDEPGEFMVEMLIAARSGLMARLEFVDAAIVRVHRAANKEVGNA